jgi:hypothetical protein
MSPVSKIDYGAGDRTNHLCPKIEVLFHSERGVQEEALLGPQASRQDDIHRPTHGQGYETCKCDDVRTGPRSRYASTSKSALNPIWRLL